MLEPGSIEQRAMSEAMRLCTHQDKVLSGNEELREQNIETAYHYILAGSHVDPELGIDYVPVSEPVKPFQRRQIADRHEKVRRLESWLLDELMDGREYDSVSSELIQRQTFKVVSLAKPSELATCILELYNRNYIKPGCLAGGCFKVLPNHAIVFGWAEELPTQDGTTDRYFAPEIKRAEPR